MFSRRTFLAALPLALPSVRPSALAARVASKAVSGVKLACQTNAWRIDPQDFAQLLAVLGKLKELGYAGFETGFRNLQGQFGNAVMARKQLEQTGLQFFGAHIFLEQYDPQTQIAPLELVQKIADGIAALGAQRLILSGGGLLNAGKVDAEALKRKAAGLNAAAQYCRAKGLRLAYHNHGPEFMQHGLEIEGLYRMTDPALVDFLLDCGWAVRGGMNVPTFFAKHHRRLIGLHLRDFKGETQVPLGQGDFPLKDLVAIIQRVQWRGWAINEEERLSGEKPGASAVAPARQTLRQVFGK
jgi:inosose dehydratase